MQAIMNPKTNLELFFCTHILKLNALHYGYWDDAENLTVDNLRLAQQRYTTTLLQLIPARVSSILDVGCGIGDISFALAEKGYQVTAISPDKYHAKFFTGSFLKNVTFFNSKFEDFHTQQWYDLILMSESQNYFDIDLGFKQCQKFLKPGGYLLVSGIFKNNAYFQEIRNAAKPYIQKAQNYGFQLVSEIDISENVLPTLKYGYQAYQQYLMPVYFLVNRFLAGTNSLKFILVKLFLWSALKRTSIEIHHYYKKRLNPALFQKHVRYLRLLFSWHPDNNIGRNKN